ncbi:MAG: hypothetical protein DMG68_03075 [Acidobacteria bacterium]|nr:MAG: hypothetical protein DMG68_03075 [Acidobacteriota bacterium]
MQAGRARHPARCRSGPPRRALHFDRWQSVRGQARAHLHLWVGPVRYAAELRAPRSLRERKIAGVDEQGAKKLIALMPGKVVRVLAPERTEVEAGQGILVVEAMKMQNEMKSPKKGVVQKILAAEGTAVNPGDVLAIVE